MAPARGYGRRPRDATADAFWTVYYEPPSEPRALRRRRLAARIGALLCLTAFAAAPIALAAYRVQLECRIDVRCDRDGKWLLRTRSGGLGGGSADPVEARRKASNSTVALVIVAHLSDEIVWAGNYLAGTEAHVMVTSATRSPAIGGRWGAGKGTIAAGAARASDEFRRSSDLLGFSGEFLFWGQDGDVDAAGGWGGGGVRLDRSIRRRIETRVCDRSWDAIVTHGYSGEYGHPQHQAVHDAVLDAVHRCCSSTARLLVFQPEPPPSIPPARNAGRRQVEKDRSAFRLAYFAKKKKKAGDSGDASDDGAVSKKEEALKVAYSAEKEAGLFANWAENIVSFSDYDYDMAGSACRSFHAIERLSSGRWYYCRVGADSRDSSDSSSSKDGIFQKGKSFQRKGQC